MNNLLKYLFVDSQEEEDFANLPGDVEQIWEDAKKVEDLESKKTPLLKALKELGISTDSLEIDPSGFVLIAADASTYKAIKEIVQKPENLTKLAELGWVGVGSGDEAMDAEEPSFKLKFLEITQDDPEKVGDKDDANPDLEDLIKKAQELGDAYDATDSKGRARGVEVKDVLDVKDTQKGVGKSESGDKAKHSVKDSVHTAQALADQLLSEESATKLDKSKDSQNKPAEMLRKKMAKSSKKVKESADELLDSPEPEQYGLPHEFRPYRCGVCGSKQSLKTNHTGPCSAVCPECSWKGETFKGSAGTGGYKIPALGSHTYRTFTYVPEGKK